MGDDMELSYEASILITSALCPAIAPFSAEPDNTLFLVYDNDNDNEKDYDNLINELLSGDYIQTKKHGDDYYWVLTDKGIEMAKIFRSYRLL